MSRTLRKPGLKTCIAALISKKCVLTFVHGDLRGLQPVDIICFISNHSWFHTISATLSAFSDGGTVPSKRGGVPTIDFWQRPGQ